MESAMFADRVLTITSKGLLKLMSGRLTDAGEVVSFQERAQKDGM